MKLAVLGLWHLGSVTAACAARHFEVVGIDFNPAVVADLSRGAAPVFEPGLDQLLAEGLGGGRLRFTTDPREACAAADILWVTHDTPVDDQDRPDVDSVLDDLHRCVPFLRAGSLVLLSAQLPAGTCARLEAGLAASGLRFACSPENLCLGDAIAVFEKPDRIVVGCRDPRSHAELESLFRPFSSNLVWMSPESAEMTKHGVNAFLALSITFVNELARLCEAVGADAKEVELGLKSERRIGPRAYLAPSGAFSGGTLARDVMTLIELGERHGRPLDVIQAIRRSNDRHRSWALERVREALPVAAGRRVALLGLTYKPRTNVLRRSAAVELARALADEGFEVRACDPSRPPLAPDLAFIGVTQGVAEAVSGADAVVVCTPWPEFLAADWPAAIAGMRRPLVIDVGRFLEKSLAAVKPLQYVTIGSPR